MLLTYQKYATPEAEEGGRVYTECEITYTASDETNATYTYDTDLKRIRKVVGGSTTKFVYDGANVVAEYNGENTLQASYITPGLDQNLTIKRAGSTYYYHQDALGSIRNISDSSQVAQNTYDYYAFGKILSETQNITSDYKFTARRWDSESGQYFYRRRYYLPALGRFSQPEPLLIIQVGYSRYTFVRSNPLRIRDPFGLCEKCREAEKKLERALEELEWAREDAMRREGPGSLGPGYLDPSTGRYVGECSRRAVDAGRALREARRNCPEKPPICRPPKKPYAKHKLMGYTSWKECVKERMNKYYNAEKVRGISGFAYTVSSGKPSLPHIPQVAFWEILKRTGSATAKTVAKVGSIGTAASMPINFCIEAEYDDEVRRMFYQGCSGIFCLCPEDVEKAKALLQD